MKTKNEVREAKGTFAEEEETTALLDGKNRTTITIVLFNIQRKVKNFGAKWKKAYN